MSFPQRLKLLREKRGLSQRELARQVNIAPSTLAMYEVGKREPDFEIVARLANFFGVSLDYLLGRTDDLGTAFLSVPGAWPYQPSAKAPILGTIRAGEPLYAEENIIGWADISEEQARSGRHFFLCVRGDSMVESGIKEGCLVLVREQPEVEDGEIAVVMIDDEEATLKGDGLKIQDAKTEKSNRIVPLAPALVEVLKEHRKKMFEEGNYGLDRPVFCTRNGTHIVPRNLNRKFDQILRRAGIEDVTLHSLRHTFATRLLELGENLKVVQELLGHARIAVTADTYSHVSQDLKRQAVEKIDRILRGK